MAKRVVRSPKTTIGKMKKTAPINLKGVSASGIFLPDVPPPKPSSPSYQLPTDTDLTLLQTELAQKLEEARALVQQMERLSGLRLVLDRNLRLVVNLTPLK